MRGGYLIHCASVIGLFPRSRVGIGGRRKFGIRLPHSVKEALEIDQATGADFWRKALNKEMSKVKVAWEARDGITLDDVRNGKVLDLIGFQKSVATLCSTSRWTLPARLGLSLVVTRRRHRHRLRIQAS